MPLSERFDLVCRGDIGCFRIFSDFTALVSTGFHCLFTEVISLDVHHQPLCNKSKTGTEGAFGYFSFTAVTHSPIL